MVDNVRALRGLVFGKAWHRTGSVEPPVDGGFGQEDQGKIEGEERGRGERGQCAENGEGGFAAPTGEDGNRRRESENSGGNSRENQYAFAFLKKSGPRLHSVVKLERRRPITVEGLGAVGERDEPRGVQYTENSEDRDCREAGLPTGHRRPGLRRPDEDFDKDGQQRHREQANEQESGQREVGDRPRNDV